MFFVTSGLYYLKSRYYDSNTGRFIKADGENCASSYVRTYTATVGSNASLTYTFTYDDSGNIIAVQVRGARSYNLSYEYDDLGQLRRENNSKLAKTFTYTYDDAGNILSKKTYAYRAGSLSGVNPTATSTYTYSSGVWGDMLTSFGGQSITYDGIGNPLTYYGGRSFTWIGRQLVSANFSGTVLSFTYDDNGLRTTKTVNGVTTNYYYSGGLLIAEVSPTSSTVYIYDAYGSPIGFKYRTNSDADGVWDSFWYEKNLQGDILGVYSDDGDRLISYTYDAWGRATITYHSGTSASPAAQNRLRYRGYYYDTDLGLYYLKSRYYDSNTGRFISADGLISTGIGLLGYNMYAYCNNNPVMYVDSEGDFPGQNTPFVIAMFSLLTGIALINHSIRLFNQSKIDGELKDHYTEAEASQEIEDYLSKYDSESVVVKVESGGVEITDSYQVANAYDRQYVSSIISRTSNSSRSVGSYSAEWLGHNVIYSISIAWGMESAAAKSVDLEYAGDGRPEVFIPTIIMQILGIG